MANSNRGLEGNGQASRAQHALAPWDPFRVMRQVLSWDPFRGLEDAPSLGGFAPTFELTEGRDAYFVRADLPGVEEDDVEISLTGNRLTISGHRERAQQEEGLRYHASERAFGRFSRSYTLPDGADPEHVHAEMTNGVLNLTISKRREAQPKRIAIARRGAGRGGGSKA